MIMESLTITTNLDQTPWVDLYGLDGQMGKIARIGLLPEGTANGRPTVSLLIEIETDDGGGVGGTRTRTIVAETTWDLLHTAVSALAAGPIVTALPPIA
jgi:hypothetical protein